MDEDIFITSLGTGPEGLMCSLTGEICEGECEKYIEAFCCGGCMHDEAHSPWARGDKPYQSTDAPVEEESNTTFYQEDLEK